RDMLAEWSERMNLIGPKELPQFWTRHALDCAQLLPLAPLAARWLDLGSGAGFPGIAIAVAQKHMMLNGGGAGETTLVESVGKKSGFLRAVVERLNLPARVFAGRYEDMKREPYDVITARAFAPLPRLLEAANRFWGQSTIGLFPKGKAIDTELTEAGRAWRFRAERVASITGDGAILRLTELSRR